MAIGSSADLVSALYAQLTNLATLISDINTAQVNWIGTGLGPTYTISTPNGSQTLDAAGYWRLLGDLTREYAELNRTYAELLQSLQPFNIRHRQRIGGSFI